MKLFISWSKNTSKEIALTLKEFLSDFFRSKNLEIYLSTSIQPGENWFDSIRDGIKDSEICIIVMTDENELSRWTHFEAGAIAFNTKSSNVIPLLVTSRDLDETSPLKHFQYVRNTHHEMLKLIRLVKSVGRLTGVRQDEVSKRFDDLYPKFEAQITATLDRSVTGAISNIPFGKVFPSDTVQVEAGKVFIGAPMASLNTPAQYQAKQRDVSHVAEAVEICCKSVRRTYWAGKDIKDPNKFDGERVALLRDLSHLKSSESCIFIIFEKLASSVLVEIGYAIALNKRTVIFCKTRTDLPFLLRRADDQM
ncbi:hypothetical protein N183_36240 [Sinorhizobium sp. Sb3]|uniref:toll/interleukin-1 receptor domain-containing protein n=1 Tax=Sinorhizobium sp. Sb3 TaxID=1358417 RepID=UPI00071DC171|nr:toll/interleukin-1 receptor domain-containing protein [Sinorhizobium sp. Sb3]KSV63092.1 hypothetical protein N183_36240 [Sinorhizobium sp. Sb3]